MQLVDAAVEKLREDGVDIGLGKLRLADIIAATGVSRSTAYRSLADDSLAPQAVLHREVLTQILSRNTRERNRVLVSDAVMAELERQEDNLGSDDVAVRTNAVRALMRVGSAVSYAEVANSTERSILTASYGALRSSGVSDWRHDELVKGEQTLATLFGELYTNLSATLGYRLKPGMSLLHFSTAIASLVEGIAMRHGVSEHLDSVERPTGPNGEIEEWTLFAIAFEGIYTMFFEPIDDEPFSDLSRY